MKTDGPDNTAATPPKVSYGELMDHVGHNIEVYAYGSFQPEFDAPDQRNIQVMCKTCDVVILEVNNLDGKAYRLADKPEPCIPRRVPRSDNEGVKDDADKIRFDLIPVSALRAYARVLRHGAKKYEDRNWEHGMEWSRYYRAALSHLTSFWAGEDVDPDSGELHLAAALFCVGALIEYTTTHPEKDNRPRRT